MSNERKAEAGFAGAHGSATCGTFTTDSPRGYKRVSCSCGRAVVRQPWMHELAWKLAQAHFTTDHAGKSPNSMLDDNPATTTI